MHGQDHGTLDYWAMFFVLLIAAGVWMWLGDWSLGMRLTVPAIGVIGLVTTIVLIKRQM
jgi:Flp pilus assembly protein TadB